MSDEKLEKKEKTQQEGYVVEGQLKESSPGYLVLWTIQSGRMTYENLCESAKEARISKDLVPELRTANNAFAVAKEELRGLRIPDLLELKGWDGPVQQTLNVRPLKKGHEYQVLVLRTGRSRGELHKEEQAVFRLKFSPPDNFDYRAWIRNYMKSFWPEEGKKAIVRPNISEMRRCLELGPYWDGDQLDPILMTTVRDIIFRAFENSIVGVDSKMLRDKLNETIFKKLNGIAYQAGRGAVFVPRMADGKETSLTLDAYSKILTAFVGYSTDTGANRRLYFDSNGKPINHYSRKTCLRYLGYLDSDREMKYIREDIGNALSSEIAEYWHNLTKVADSFNKDKVEEFEKRLTNMELKRTVLKNRIAKVSSTVGGTIEINTDMFTDLDANFKNRINAIPSKNKVIVNKLKNLADVSK